MAFLYYGFNGFHQWVSDDLSDRKPKELKIIKNLFPINEDIKIFDVFISWCYNIYLINDRVFIRGFYINNINVIEELINPRNDFVTNFTANDDYILLYNTSDKYIWKFDLDEDVEQKWKLLPNFIQTERIDEVDKECLSKVVCSTRMNIALTDKGRVFNIPYEISFNYIGKIIDVACGYEHGILLTDFGNVYTWGNGSRCQLGHGSTENCDEPELVEALSGIKMVYISAGGWHCCAISEFGDLYVWGWNDKNQLGIYSPNNLYNSNMKTKDDLVSKSGTSKRKKCGSDKDNVSVLPNYASPILVDLYDVNSDSVLEKNVLEVHCGSEHTIIKLEDGTVWGSGCNKYGQLCCDSRTVENIPYFTKLDVGDENYSIKCGAWGTTFLCIQ